MKSITSEEVALLHQILQPYHAVSANHLPRPLVWGRPGNSESNWNIQYIGLASSFVMAFVSNLKLENSSQ